jgi:transposase-like protein
MRKLFGVLFALVAIRAVADLIVGSEDFGSRPGMVIAAVVLLAALAAVTAVYLLRSQRMRDAEMTCPKCSQAGGLRDHNLTRPRPSIAAFFFGGLIITLLIEYLPAQRFECSVCPAVTYRRSYSSLIILAWCGLTVFLIYVACIIPETP